MTPAVNSPPHTSRVDGAWARDFGCSWHDCARPTAARTQVEHADAYLRQLDAAGIVLDGAIRSSSIWTAAQEAAAQCQGEFVPACMLGDGAPPRLGRTTPPLSQGALLSGAQRMPGPSIAGQAEIGSRD